MVDTIRAKLRPSCTNTVKDETLTGLLGYNINRVANAIHHELAKTLKPLDLRMITFTTLVLIVDNPGVRQSQLAASLFVERPNFVVIINELLRRGLVTRKQDTSDRRAYGLYVTTAGRQLHAIALRAVKARENTLLCDLNQHQRRQVAASMKLLRQIP